MQTQSTEINKEDTYFKSTVFKSQAHFRRDQCTGFMCEINFTDVMMVSDTRTAVIQTAYKINVIDKGTLGYES